jgi:hypothetical protein
MSEEKKEWLLTVAHDKTSEIGDTGVFYFNKIYFGFVLR